MDERRCNWKTATMKTYSRKKGDSPSNVIIHVNELCRLCLAKEEEMVPLYEDETVPLPLRILACVNIEVGFSREPGHRHPSLSLSSSSSSSSSAASVERRRRPCRRSVEPGCGFRRPVSAPATEGRAGGGEEGGCSARLHAVSSGGGDAPLRATVVRRQSLLVHSPVHQRTRQHTSAIFFS